MPSLDIDIFEGSTTIETSNRSRVHINMEVPLALFIKVKI
jgi:hypothetical protein